MAITKKEIGLLPSEPGVYLMKDDKGKILYIGKAKNIKKRVRQYFLSFHDERAMVPFLISQVKKINTIVTFSETEALLIENSLIKQHQPKYNILLKDDKTFISLVVNHLHPWPRIQLVRYKGKPQKGNLVFGPYTSAFAAKQTLEAITKVFRLRQCSDLELKSRKRPCILYSMKRCLAPCMRKCTREEYDKEMKGAIQLLRGGNKQILTTLKKRRKKAIEHLAFEEAKELHVLIQSIQQIIEERKSSVQTRENSDVFHLYQQGQHYTISQLVFREGKLIESKHFSFEEPLGEKKEIWATFLLQHYCQLPYLPPPQILLPIKLTHNRALEEILSGKAKRKVHILSPKKGAKFQLLQLAQKNAKSLFMQERSHILDQEKRLMELQESCNLAHYPLHIDCFDTSNISGTDLVASMVGFTDGLRDKKRTRFFLVKNITKPDDYGALREVLTRYYTKAKEKEELPDLLLIDGGKGQLTIALKVLQKLQIASIDILSIAKEEGKHTKGMSAEKIYLVHKKEPILLPPYSPSLLILQKIRDETHRVALTFHQKRRKKRILQSALDQIPGIGPKKRTLLLRHLGSIKRIKEAKKKELEAIHGINKTDIQKILAWIYNQ